MPLKKPQTELDTQALKKVETLCDTQTLPKKPQTLRDTQAPKTQVPFFFEFPCNYVELLKQYTQGGTSGTPGQVNSSFPLITGS